MTGRLVTGALALVAALRLTTSDDGLLTTVPQRDDLRSAYGAPTVDVSADGRFVAFESFARLVPGDTDDSRDVYVLDRAGRTVTLESGSLEGDGSHPRISGDGRYLTFEALARVTDSARLQTDIVVRDRASNTTRVLAGRRGEPANGQSRGPEISDDGRVVAFASSATNLVSGPDFNGHEEDVYSYDGQSGTIRRISVNTAGVQPASGASMLPSLSADGRWIAFVSNAPLDAGSERTPPVEQAPGTPRKTRHIFLRDTTLGVTTRLGGDGSSRSGWDSGSPAISADGRYVAFMSEAPNLVSGDRNGIADVFLFDRQTGSTMLVSRAADGGSANGASLNPALSADGRFVAFQSDASNLVCGRRCPPTLQDINLLWDVFVFDRVTRTTMCASADELGGWMEASAGPALSAAGDVLAFSSRHPIDGIDRKEDFDLFVRMLSP